METSPAQEGSNILQAEYPWKTVKIRPKTAEELANDLEEEALFQEMTRTGAIHSPGIYTVEDLEADDAALRAQGK